MCAMSAMVSACMFASSGRHAQLASGQAPCFFKSPNGIQKLLLEGPVYSWLCRRGASHSPSEDEAPPGRQPSQAAEEHLSRAELEHVHCFIGRPRATVHRALHTLCCLPANLVTEARAFG